MYRFWSKVEKTESCWVWIANKRNGYGRFWLNSKNISAHKFSYQLIKGGVPEGYVLDHLCKNPSCVNPEHLEVVTQKENVRRGVGISAINKIKTHCLKGHEFNEKNTYIRPNGMRNCRCCHNERMIVYNRKKGIVRP